MPTKKKGHGWKDVQSKAKIKKRSKLALLVLALVLGLLFLSWSVRFTQNLFSPFKLSVQQQKNYVWNGEFNINLLIRTSQISLLSYNPKQERITIINIPNETFLNVPHGFGLWQLRAVYGLGGDKLLMEALTSFFGVPVDGFLDFSLLKPQKTTVELVNILRRNSFSGLNLLSFLKTDLTLWELLRLKLNMGSVRFDKIKELDLAEVGVLDGGNLPDGTQILTTDPVKLDSVLSPLADPVIVSEHKSIAVLNATEHPQLAQKWARLITNLGGNVIIMSNTDKGLKKTQVFGEPSFTLRRLRQIFGLDDKISPPDGSPGSARAQINVLLGEDVNF